MLRKIVSAIIIVPLVVVLIGFAVANRQAVTVSFDPFDQAHPAYALTLPLFGIVFVILIVGVLVGGIAAWLKQSHWRRAARSLDREVRALREENEALRRHPVTGEVPVRPQIAAPAGQPENVPPILPPIVP